VAAGDQAATATATAVLAARAGCAGKYCTQTHRQFIRGQLPNGRQQPLHTATLLEQRFCPRTRTNPPSRWATGENNSKGENAGILGSNNFYIQSENE